MNLITMNSLQAVNNNYDWCVFSVTLLTLKVWSIVQPKKIHTCNSIRHDAGNDYMTAQRKLATCLNPIM